LAALSSAAGTTDLPGLIISHNHQLQAISIAAVFFGAATYIGNGPNFMVKSIAEQNGVRMPSFVEFVVKFSLPFLLPVLLIIWLLFFRG
jgi:Na+/H+ antiporter NhaD/arsenite permease-like protein